MLSRALSIDCLTTILMRTLVYPSSLVKVWKLDETSIRCCALCSMQRPQIPLRCPMSNDRNFLAINSLSRVTRDRNRIDLFSFPRFFSDTLYSPEISEAAAARSRGQSLRQQNTTGIPQQPTASGQTPEHESMIVTPSALHNGLPPSMFCRRDLDGFCLPVNQFDHRSIRFRRG